MGNNWKRTMEGKAKITMIKTKPEEFKKFHNALMSNAPKDYIPWYFPVIKNNKAPDGMAISKKSPKFLKGTKGNWKAEWARLTFEDALERIKQGYNVGISGRANDPLVIIDIDRWEYIKHMPKTLIVVSRKRSGIHGFFWKSKECKILPVNIPTDYGEIRSSDQYVVAAGSYVKTNPKCIDDEKLPITIKDEIKKDKELGCYTIKFNISPKQISFENIPYFFRIQYNQNKKKEKTILKSKTIKPTGKHSALFDLKITDIVSTKAGRRESHPLHSSDTGMNFSICNDLAHCWRHLVSLNAIQFLVVKSGYMSCQNAGSGHNGSGAGSSDVINNNGAIFYAWLQAKKDNLIPKDDPVPIKAMKYIAYKHKIISNQKEAFNSYSYNQVIDIIEKKY